MGFKLFLNIRGLILEVVKRVERKRIFIFLKFICKGDVAKYSLGGREIWVLGLVNYNERCGFR